MNHNRLFYLCLLSDLAFEWQRGWKWLVWYRPLCFCQVNLSWSEQFNNFIYTTKAAGAGLGGVWAVRSNPPNWNRWRQRNCKILTSKFKPECNKLWLDLKTSEIGFLRSWILKYSGGGCPRSPLKGTAFGGPNIVPPSVKSWISPQISEVCSKTRSAPA